MPEPTTHDTRYFTESYWVYNADEDPELADTAPRKVAHEPREEECCERGTPGCCIQHSAEVREGRCEAW